MCSRLLIYNNKCHNSDLLYHVSVAYGVLLLLGIQLQTDFSIISYYTHF